MELKKVTGKSKNGKEWVGYTVKIGRYQTPLFFPSEVELWYIEQYLEKSKNNNGDVE